MTGLTPDGPTASGFAGALIAGAMLELAELNDSGNAFAISSFGGGPVPPMSFRLLTPHVFALSGNVAADGGQTIVSFDGNVFDTDFFEGPFSISGVLGPGDYEFSAIALADLVGVRGPGIESEAAGADFTFMLRPVPVPEPATILLLGAGIAVGARRLKRRA